MNDQDLEPCTVNRSNHQSQTGENKQSKMAIATRRTTLLRVRFLLECNRDGC